MNCWKVKTSLLLALAVFAWDVRANVVITPWVPIFRGVDRAVGTNFPSTTYENNGVFYTDSTLQVVNCVRVDLSDPDVQLFTTPRATNYIAESSETYSISVSNFIKRYGVQVATVANFSYPQNGPDSPVEGLPSRVYGLQISTGSVVSVPDFGPDSNNRYASMLFTTNKVPYLALFNAPPGTNTDGIYTAVSGYYAVLTNGVIIGNSALTAAYPDPSFHQLQPRTLFGLSEDRRYLYLIIIDGRQSSYSNGANDNDMGFWLLLFGAWDGLAMDGGGSTAMYMENCSGGNPVSLGRSSFLNTQNPPRERILGSHLGVFAAPLLAFINNVTATSAVTSATIAWKTISNATAQVEYGTTPNLGTFSTFDPTLSTNHSITLSGLISGTRYYYRVLSAAGGVTNTVTCAGAFSFVTTNFAGGTLLPITQNWRWQTDNLDFMNWQTTNYNDSAWSNGPACLWSDNRNPVPATSTNTIPNFATGTRMPIDLNTGYPFVTYYFRTAFTYSNSLTGLSLTFSNYIDDGAVFYLNGFEIFRTNISPGVVNNGDYTPAGAPCNGNATCPLIFTLTGSALSNVIVGTNILAVEVHNFRSLTTFTPSPDVTFECAVQFALPPPVIPPPFITNVVVVPGETNATFTWTTLSNSTSQIFFGTTPALGSSNALDANLVSNHAMVVAGLKPVTDYYFRIVSSIGTNQNTYDGTFTTTSFFLPLVTFSNLWRFQTANLSGTNWTAPNYSDAGWTGQGQALLYVEDNPSVTPRTTPLPLNSGALFPTYYFRTHFNFSGSTVGFALLFTNLVDDGAVFYLNGNEIQRLRMNPGPVGYNTFANSCPVDLCDSTLDARDVFRLSGTALTNLLAGDNVLAAEVHQLSAAENDVVFGSAVGLVRALVSETPLRISRSNNIVCVSWDGLGFTLQRANALTGTNVWSDVLGPITSGPYCTTNPATTTYFRLRD